MSFVPFFVFLVVKGARMPAGPVSGPSGSANKGFEITHTEALAPCFVIYSTICIEHMSRPLHVKIKIIAALISVILLAGVAAVIFGMPGGMFLSSFYFMVICLGILLLVSGVAARIIQLLAGRGSFLILFSCTTSAASMAFLILYYDPGLTITCPKGYTGAVVLVLTTADRDILTLDSNGIGYITRRTFKRTYRKPRVIDAGGTDISARCVGYNPSTFWANSTYLGGGQKIRSLSFELVPEDQKGQKQYYTIILDEKVDKTKISPDTD